MMWITIAAAAQHDRWAALVRGSGLSPSQADAAIASQSFGALTAELRRSEAHHLDIESLLSRVVAARGFEDAQDVAAVLRTRIATTLTRVAGAGRSRKAPLLIVGLVPRAFGSMTAEMRQSLDERSDLIEARASAVLDEALHAGDSWTHELGAFPHQSTRWRQHARTVAAYRDRYAVVGASALGPAPQTMVQRRDAARARAALKAAKWLSDGNGDFESQRPGRSRGPRPLSIRI